MAKGIPAHLLFVSLVACASLGAGQQGQADGLLAAHPAKSLSPTEVVRIQLAALAHNAVLGGDMGIDVTWRFASPSNKAATGPFVRFRDMVKAGYPEILDHRRFVLGELDLTAIEAKQVVVLEDQAGAVHAYLWVLGLQEDGAYRGCWMTDAVIELRTTETEGPKADDSVI